ncbi:PDZ domain-containing protein [Aquibacillus sp. 3ASR75-11]|uniref:endopeptidase La n=1 Tax=Terrihalobacillus insolitus TaxID=2950438 RepID=A0A9X3WS79_9BACI|nr:PDZ domain-containing protein [Terrihalobacillus insolitus]MDC3423708.1 PDZ domain-containing protein [Terrihalobacillus insolitus]
MRNKRYFIVALIVVVLTVFLVVYRLPYYVYKPGGADPLNPVIKVDGGFESKGDMHLVTVRGGQANVVQYVLAKILPYQEIYPIDQIMPEGITQDEYFNAQLQLMENSQEAATVVAYKAANKDIEIDYKGVYVVAVIEGMPADGKLQAGDNITQVNGQPVEQTDDLIGFVETKKAGDTVDITVKRDGKELKESITLEKFPDLDDKVGVGIQLVTDRSVEVSPDITFSSGNIGGPSAGLMFSLEIYDQLTENDLTKGYQIAGTGEISYDGKVLPIGGVDKKVIAANEEGCSIFFAPNENGASGSDYEVAVKTAKEIDSNMKIVPVDTFEDALNYLEKLKPKK